MLAYILYIGGWGCGAGFSPTLEPGNRFRLRLRLRCVRASERSCERETILQWLGLGARICKHMWVVVVVRPSVRAAISMKSLRSETFDR